MEGVELPSPSVFSIELSKELAPILNLSGVKASSPKYSFTILAGLFHHSLNDELHHAD